MSGDEDDPFEAFEDADEREGDPFERLGGVEPTEGSDAASDGDGGADDGTEATPPTDDTDEPAFEEEFIDQDDPFQTGPGQSPTDEATGDREAGSDADPLGGDDPFGGMAGREGDPFDDGESVFESVDVESVDADEVWASLDEEPSTPSVEGSRYVEVSKHRFCEQCEHFASPPNAHCTHEEAEIIEYLDMETVRLLNCPVVAEQRELEDEG
ncbi:hypothetical protein [Haloarcula laminariae]|uniref:hypothetical protein n=1 Tax=Haloarcula laminariae TaxID=2961577 RepID=UPI0021C997F8|nr:hypothetical protein [Halomicroarcula laminariae]